MLRRRDILLGIVFLPSVYIVSYYIALEPHRRTTVAKFSATSSQRLHGKKSNLFRDNLASNERKATTRASNKTEAKAGNILYKNILMWTEEYIDSFNEPPEICGYCSLTYDRNLLTDPQTAVVIFPLRSTTYDDYPRNNSRRSKQLYLWQSGESPIQTQRILAKRNLDLRDIEDYYFNGTYTFRRDSLIPRAYIKIFQHLQGEANLTRLMAKKKKSAIWFASNYVRGSNAVRRLLLSEELIQNGLALDRVGQCFQNQDEFSDRESQGFIHSIEEYHFYMAFENSYHCRDYITEKFFVNALRGGAVPVVSGATKEDYEYHAPPHSYIHVEDFGSTKELVDYLHYLERNRTAYEEYFAWRKLDPDDYFPFGRHYNACAMCRAAFGIPLDDPRTFEEVYGKNGERYDPSVGFAFSFRLKSVYDWWYGTESEECFKIDAKFRNQSICVGYD